MGGWVGGGEEAQLRSCASQVCIPYTLACRIISSVHNGQSVTPIRSLGSVEFRCDKRYTLKAIVTTVLVDTSQHACWVPSLFAVLCSHTPLKCQIRVVGLVRFLHRP